MDDIPERRERTLVEAGAAPAEPYNPPLLSWDLRFDEAGSLPPPRTQTSTEQGGGVGAKFSGEGRTAGGGEEGAGGAGGGAGGGARGEATARRFLVRNLDGGGAAAEAGEIVMCGTGGQQSRVAM